MRVLDKLRLRLRSVFRRRTVERELAHDNLSISIN